LQKFVETEEHKAGTSFAIWITTFKIAKKKNQNNKNNKKPPQKTNKQKTTKKQPNTY